MTFSPPPYIFFNLQLVDVTPEEPCWAAPCVTHSVETASASDLSLDASVTSV